MPTGKGLPVELSKLGETMVLLGSSPSDQHAAAVTTAEAAIASSWPRADLVDVLGALGLTEAGS